MVELLGYQIFGEEMSIKLVCPGILYYSPIDEVFFFEWIAKIPSIERMGGVGYELDLYIKGPNIPDLQELVTLFRRYRIETAQLAVFLSDDNRHWLAKELLAPMKNISKAEVKVEFTSLLNRAENG